MSSVRGSCCSVKEPPWLLTGNCANENKLTRLLSKQSVGARPFERLVSRSRRATFFCSCETQTKRDGWRHDLSFLVRGRLLTWINARLKAPVAHQILAARGLLAKATDFGCSRAELVPAYRRAIESLQKWLADSRVEADQDFCMFSSTPQDPPADKTLKLRWRWNSRAAKSSSRRLLRKDQ